MAAMPTFQEMEEWLEQTIHDNIPTHLQELSFKVGDTIYAYTEAVYSQLTKYGSPVSLPSLQEIEDHMPSNPFAKCPHAPISAPPPPPPRGVLGRSIDWAYDHRHTFLLAGGVAVIGLGTSLAYQSGLLWLPYLGKRDKQSIEEAQRRKLRTPSVKNGVRKEAVVVLGADTPLGRAIALHLASVGFIVIASVSSSTALTSFNSIIPPSSRGYVKTLLFETSDVASSLTKFIRSVDEVLKLRFPLLTAGDPYAAPGEEVGLVGVVNTLSYLPPSNAISPATGNPFQSNPAELAESMERHVVAALCALSSLQPLLTSPPTRGSLRGQGNQSKENAFPAAATAITLLSSPSSHTSLPGAAKESVVAQAAAAGIEVIRREAEDRLTRETNITSSSSTIAPHRRPLRVTTVEIDEGTPWGSTPRRSTIGEGDLTASSTSNASNSTSASTISTADRPTYLRKASSFPTWSSRDNSTQLVLSRVTSLLLTSDPTSRLKSIYRVYLPTDKETSYWGQTQALFNRGTQRLMRIIPTAWMDVLLSLRRHVSLRRAGLIGQGPRPSRNISQGSTGNTQRSVSLSRSSASQGGAATTSRRPGASAASLAPPSSATMKKGYHYPNTSSGSASTSGPPSLPDSNSGDSTFHGDTEDGMVSSGVLDSHSEPEGDMAQSARSLRGRRAGSSNEGPWMGPDEVSEREEQPEEKVEDDDHGDEEEEEDQAEGEGSTYVGESWVALGESSRRDREEE